jgi:hypothetical protein
MSSTPVFDIVIPLGPNDVMYIWPNLQRNRENIVGHRNIYIVTKDPSGLPADQQEQARANGCTLIDEAIFPFQMSDVIAIHGGVNWRNGWYLQQLLKLYAGFVIPDILPRYLVVDADTVFLKPTRFISDDNKCFINVGREYHVPYFEHMKRMHPTFEKQVRYSGISHHMMFERDYVADMMRLVEEHHNGKIFWRVFLEEVTDIMGSGASEYEMYFNYMIRYHGADFRIRALQWGNAPRIIEGQGLDYVSVHWAIRK